MREASMSAKSVAEKLLIKPSATVWSSHSTRLDLIEPLPEGVRHVDRPDQATTALVFTHASSPLRAALDAHRDQGTGRISEIARREVTGRRGVSPVGEGGGVWRGGGVGLTGGEVGVTEAGEADPMSM